MTRRVATTAKEIVEELNQCGGVADWQIERRRTGHPRYRVVRLSGVLGEFWTLRGAQRYIQRNEWERINGRAS